MAMRLLVLNPNTSDELTSDIDAVAQRRARAGVEVLTVRSASGPETIEGNHDEVIATAHMLRALTEHADSSDAVVIACFGDPGLYAAREVSPVPVVGMAEAAMHYACLVADRFAVVTILERMVPHLRHTVARHGLESRCASIRTTGCSVLDCVRDPQGTTAAVLAAARAAIDDDGAEAIILGCSGMSGLVDAVAGQLEVPVVDGLACAIKLAEGLVDCGLRTSRRAAFMAPAAA